MITYQPLRSHYTRLISLNDNTRPVQYFQVVYGPYDLNNWSNDLTAHIAVRTTCVSKP